MIGSTAPFKLTRIPTLKTVADFRQHIATLGLDLPCEDAIASGKDSPLTQALPNLTVNGKRIGNRWAIHPMEGWDATTTGGATDEVRRRWQRFGESGAKVIYGGEAMAVRPDGRAVFFCEHLASRRGNARVDLLEQFGVEQGDIVPQGLMAEVFDLVVPRRGGQAEHLAHERVVIGDVFHPIPVRVEAEADDAEHENLPEVYAGATGALLAGEDFGFEQGEHLGLERGLHPDPLEARQDRRQLVPALERQANLFDGGDLEIGLGLEVVAHGEEQQRMLRVQTPETPPTFKHTANIRTRSSSANPTPARRFAFNAGH